MDDDSYLFLAGRRSDMILRSGENVHPVEIESVLADQPAVRAVAVVGLPDDHWGEVVAAAVEVAEGVSVTPEDLQRHCRSRLAAYKVPSVVEVVASMPRNVNGKVQKHVLSAELTAGRAGD
jgi:acyl-CoA synthetase (AMP-forming)/AMP-acid ligase II